VTLKPCIDCGVPSEASRCPEHAPSATELRHTSARERGYDAAWDRLSRKARTLQPWSLDCGSTEGLTTDHLPSAWERKAQRKPIRLQDVEVVCGGCNNRRGSSRIVDKDLTTRGGDPSKQRRGPEGEAKSRLHTEAESQSDAREPPLLIGAPGRNVLDAEPSAGREAQTLATAVENRQDCAPAVDFVPGHVAGVRLDLAVAERHAEIRHDRSLP